MADNNRTTTTTQIRNLYSEGMSYLNIKFFNTNLCFSFYPFVNKDNTGRSTYDMKNGVSTTVNFEGAYALYDTAKNIIDGKITECDLPIPCAAGANLKLERKMGPNGVMETLFSISKNGANISFRFPVVNMQVKTDNGQFMMKSVESGLGAFMKTVEGYLNGINADRHLDKLTDDYVKTVQDNNQGQQPSGGQQQNWNNSGKSNNGGYRNNGGNYNNNNGYKKPYNNNGYNKPRQYNNNNGGGWQPPQQQNLNSYEIKN